MSLPTLVDIPIVLTIALEHAVKTSALAATGVAEERRRARREPLVTEIKLRPEHVGGPLILGCASDISALGAGLHMPCNMRVGESFRLRIEVGPLRWWNRVRVVSCRNRAADQFDVGVEFVSNYRCGETPIIEPLPLAA